MQFDASVMNLLGGAKASVCQLASHARTVSARSHREHDGQAIDQTVCALFDVLTCTGQLLMDEQLESRKHFVDSSVESLITRQGRKPISPVLHHIIIDATVCGVTLEMPEDVHRDQLFVCKSGLEVTQALMFQDRMFIV